MAIIDVILAEEPADAALFAAIADAYDAEPSTVRPLGSYVGSEEGRVASAIIVDRRPVSGDFTIALSIAAKPKVDTADIAAKLAGSLKLDVLFEAAPGRYRIAKADGAAVDAALAETEDSAEIRLASAAAA